MQLKRILARDSRAATDKAIAMYGSDVLIISNHVVNGQTELVVALDLPGSPASSADLHALPLGMVAPMPESEPAAPEPTSFLDTLIQAQWKPGASPAPAVAASQTDARDYLRGREIVDMVREELSSLRREFRLSQQTSGWQNQLSFSAELEPVARVIGEAAMPQELRALLLDSLKDHASADEALQALNEQLTHALARPSAPLPTQGVHLLAGPSGAGKTLMAARLARHAGNIHGAHQVAIISYHDARAGAWSQVQMLAAQLGVDCFRAGDAATLGLLLNELAPRRLVLIDTPGVQMKERMAEVLSVQPDCGCHAVVPADASSATLSRLGGSGFSWDSLLLSKVDESTQPWSLLHFLSNNSIALAGASDGAQAADLVADFAVPQLVALGLAQIQPVEPIHALDATAALTERLMAERI